MWENCYSYFPMVNTISEQCLCEFLSKQNVDKGITNMFYSLPHLNLSGIKFLQAHTIQLQNETDYSLLPCRFEIIFPSILTEAKSFGLDLPYDIPCLKDITALREHKISRYIIN